MTSLKDQGPHPESPIVVAAWKVLHEIYAETGGGDAFNPNRSPVYLAAQRIWIAVLEAHREIIHERTKVRIGGRSLAVVNGGAE